MIDVFRSRCFFAVFFPLAWAFTAAAQQTSNFEQLRSSVENLLEQPSDADVIVAAETTANWIMSISSSELAARSVEDLAWLLKRVTYHALSTPGGFSATWSGQLAISRSGNYTFSISPIDVRTDLQGEVHRASMNVTVNDQKVVDATPENWRYEGNPIQLNAGERAPIRVEFRYECPEDKFTVGKPPLAFLYWQGPGLSKSIVPSEVLFTPDGSSNGLQVIYRRINGNGAVLATLVEPRIEAAWLGKRNFIAPHPEAQKKVSQELWRRVIDPMYLATLDSDGSQHLLAFETNLATYLTSEQRREFLQLLIDWPSQIDRLNTKSAFEIYDCFRHGAHEKAMEFLGAWMQAHATIEPALSLEHYQINRSPYRDLTIRVVWQDTRAFEQLSQFVEMPDGSCSLPAAYTLAYGYLVQGRMDEWIALVDGKLEELATEGERRVNWLLARAMAEEVRHLPASRYLAGQGDLSSAFTWLDEATLVAERSETQLRIRKERISRLVGLRQWHGAEQEVQSQQELDSWRGALATLREQERLKTAQHAQDADEAYARELLRRQRSLSDAAEPAFIE